MPLKRGSDGSLGVESTVNVNVKNYGNNNVDVQQDGNDINVIIGQVAKSIITGGSVGQAMQQSYGVSRAGGAY